MSKVHVHYEFDSIAEAAAFFATQNGPAKPSTPAAAADHLDKIVKESVKPAAAAPAAASTPAPAPTPAAAPVAAPATDAYKPLGELIAKLVAKDRTKAVAYLKDLGVKKGPELKPEQYAEATTKVEALLAELAGESLS
jgi:hypothetical protein